MKVSLLSVAMLATAFTVLPANAQRSTSAQQLGIYREDPGSRSHDERDWHDFGKYDYDRFESGQRAYYANRYYRDWRYYEMRTLVRSDRIYRGSGGGNQYFCRRADGTTGKIEGLAGHVRSDILVPGGSSLIADLIEKNESRLGEQVDRGKIVCR